MIKTARIAAAVGRAAAKKDFSGEDVALLAAPCGSSSFRAASAPHSASTIPPTNAGAKTVTSFQVGPGMAQSDIHSDRLVLIQIDQSRQITENTPMIRSVCSAIPTKLRCRSAVLFFRPAFFASSTLLAAASAPN